MVKYEDIKKANESIQTTAIKGKDYAEVNQRIKAFRMVYPDGFISTEMLQNENGVCIFRAEVGYQADNGDGNVLGVGTAYEKEGSSFINKTSYIENCETSAVGRALGMAGFGIDTSVASFEEVKTAIANQGKKEEIEKGEKVMCPKCGIQILNTPVRSGKVLSPDEVMKKWGMCDRCYKEEIKIKKTLEDLKRERP